MKAYIRTIVPMIVSVLASYGFDIDNEIVSGLIFAIYYFVIHELEKRVDPRFGKLLGAEGTPSYGGTSAPDPQ